MVTTGQQAGFLTGPLYTVYKALTVARLAGSLEERFGMIVLPVFWTASEDHDWAEVNHAFLLDGDDEVRRLELPSDGDRALPMSQMEVGAEVKQVLEKLSQILYTQPFADEYTRLVRDAYRPGRSVAGAFSAMLAGLLAPFDVLLTDAADPNLKRASAPVLRHALEHADSLAAALRGRGAALTRAGYHAQVAVLDGATNVFYHGTGQRERIDLSPGGFRLHESHRLFEGGPLLSEVDANPARFSPNALLRPVVESAVFPTLAYVAGPGEISYFAQSEVLFREMGIEPPVVHPRFSATLVEPPVRRLLDRLGLDASELSRPRHELATRLAREAVPPEVRAGLAELARSLTEGYRRLIDEASRIDPSLRGSLGALRNESLARLAESERKIVRRVRVREEVLVARLDRVRAHLRPEGQPQERVLSPVSFLARFGPELLRRLHASVEVSWAEAGAREARPVPDPAS